jgi:hypothetical protein
LAMIDIIGVAWNGVIRLKRMLIWHRANVMKPSISRVASRWMLGGVPVITHFPKFARSKVSIVTTNRLTNATRLRVLPRRSIYRLACMRGLAMVAEPAMALEKVHARAHPGRFNLASRLFLLLWRIASDFIG